MPSTIRSTMLLLALVASCDDDGDPVLPDASTVLLDAFEPAWVTPQPGEYAAWDIQLAAPFDTTEPHQMYVLDLWDVTPAGPIDYGGGVTVTAPDGPIAGRVAELKMRSPVPFVVCHIDTGAIALDDPDAMLFPAGVIGEPTPDGKRYLDTRAEARAMWEAFVFARFEHAKALGCDAVDAHHNDAVGSSSGFAIDGDVAVAWFRKVAIELHARNLGAGLRATTDAGSLLADGLEDPSDPNNSFDFVIFERCAEFEICDRTQRFTTDNKAVFALDFTVDANGGIAATTACSRHTGDQDGLHKNDPPDGAYRMQCP